MADDKTSVDLDLDALAPKQVNINYKKQLIKVNPLDLEQFAKLYELSGDMVKLGNETDTKKVVDMFKRVEALIKEAIPELKDEQLNQTQLTALINLLSNLNTPQDKALAELKKRGITLTKEEKSGPKVSTS